MTFFSLLQGSILLSFKLYVRCPFFFPRWLSTVGLMFILTNFSFSPPKSGKNLRLSRVQKKNHSEDCLDGSYTMPTDYQKKKKCVFRNGEDCALNEQSIFFKKIHKPHMAKCDSLSNERAQDPFGVSIFFFVGSLFFISLVARFSVFFFFFFFPLHIFFYSKTFFW